MVCTPQPEPELMSSCVSAEHASGRKRATVGLFTKRLYEAASTVFAGSTSVMAHAPARSGSDKTRCEPSSSVPTACQEPLKNPPHCTPRVRVPAAAHVAPQSLD